MKKTYINPTITIVEIKAKNMIASSPLDLFTDAADTEFGMDVKSYDYNGHSGSVNWDDDWSN